MSVSSILYFACFPGFLDPFTLQYRWFGAVWKHEATMQKVGGYWFGTEEDDVIQQAQREGFRQWKQITDTTDIHQIYTSMREQQKKLDWEKRSILPLKIIYTWRHSPTGWYVIHSRHSYPFYISVVKKNKLFAWLMHADICENTDDVSRFINKVNREHNIKLREPIFNFNGAEAP